MVRMVCWLGPCYLADTSEYLQFYGMQCVLWMIKIKDFFLLFKKQDVKLSFLLSAVTVCQLKVTRGFFCVQSSYNLLLFHVVSVMFQSLYCLHSEHIHCYNFSDYFCMYFDIIN